MKNATFFILRQFFSKLSTKLSTLSTILFYCMCTISPYFRFPEFMLYSSHAKKVTIVGNIVMNTITINTDQKLSATVVPNLFIDRYMPAANGAYVKVYLYLLRCLSGSGEYFSLSSAADALDETEKDILRALSYWEKCRVLDLSRTGDAISGITLLELEQNTTETPDGSRATGTLISLEKHRRDMQSSSEKEPENDLYERPSYTDAELERLREKSDLTFVLNAVELYLERLLTPQDINLVAFLQERLGFSTDLILHLYEYCISKNKKKCEYIEKVAVSWHKDGIDSVEKAQEHSLVYDACFSAVNKGFSLGRLPIGPERDYVKKWSNYHFAPQIIEEACNRTILNIGKPDFKYADRILESWHTSGVSTLADILALDAGHEKRTKTTDSARPMTAMTKSAGNYNNYPQRQYTDDELLDLERRLLQM